jgi:type IV fimbrial biogenesis protein FimT
MELIITIVIFSILSAVAYPSYRSIMQNMRVSAMTNDFMAALAYARSEALTRGTSVSVCAASSSAGTSCGTSANWNNGWIVFVDADADGVIANASDRLQVHDALAAGSVVTTTQAFVTYNRSGFTSAGAGNFTLTAPSCSGNSARLINIANTGRADVSATACTLP